MKSPYVGDLVANEIVTAQFLVIAKEIRQKKTGEPYLSLQLSDRTGEIEAKMWDNVAEVMDSFDRDDFVKVKGLAQLYQNRSQFTVHKLRRMEEHEVELADYFPCASRDAEEMFAELQGIIEGLGNEHLRALLRAIFSDTQLATQYKTAPAAKSIHHACRGGLLEHVLSLCQLCRLAASHYKHVDLDLLLTGAVLHDIGKVEELQYSRSFSYSAPGQLLGHIAIGFRMVDAKISALPDFPPKLRLLVEHMILSHHGTLEYGSPKVPMFLEALLLHHLDNLDSKMEAMRVAVQRDASINEFTGWIAPLERVVLKKDQFLQDAPPVPLPREPVQQPLAPPSAKPPTPAREPRPATPTLFGEKLQAVLGDRK
jgi:3'-5' exoribonuclease